MHDFINNAENIYKYFSFYKILPLRELRRTHGVKFDEIQSIDIPNYVRGIDIVKHKENAFSPGSLEFEDKQIERPWYMHQEQTDLLLVLKGTRHVDLYNPVTREKVSFTVTPDQIYVNGQLYYDGPVLLGWSFGIFHRVESGQDGSVSINFSNRTKDFDIRNNFSIYDLDEETGNHKLIRDGHEDQHNYQLEDSNETQIKNKLNR